jgi:hypothetical protein
MPQRDSRPFVAQFHGHCAGDCGDPIRIGDEVRYLADELMHDECAGQIAARPAARPEPAPCPRCWTVHAGDCI